MNRIKQFGIFLLIALFLLSFISCVHSNQSSEGVLQSNDASVPVTLNLTPDKTEFKILQLADTQLRDPSDAFLKSRFALIKAVVQASKPDLIVLTGDNTEGPRGQQVLKKLIPFLDSFQIPYASVFGNHDAEGGSREQLAQYYLKGKMSLFRKGPSNIEGVGNYVIQLTQNGKVQYSLYLLDSNRYRKYSQEEKNSSVWGGTDYDYIYPNQIDWYATSVQKTNEENGRLVPSLLFFHIAIPEFRAYKEAKPEEILIPVSKKGEKVCNPYVNTGLFAKIKELGSTQGVFVGHDHINNFVFKYQGVILGYGLKSGETSYYDKDLQGGTLITLKNNFKAIEVKHLYRSELN